MKRNERNTESVSGRHEAPAIGKETYSSYEEQPRPEKRKAKKKSFNATPILLLLVILFGAIFGYSAYRLYGMMSEYHVSRKRYNAVADSAISTVAPAPTTVPFAAQPGQEIAATPEDVSPIQVDFDALLDAPLLLIDDLGAEPLMRNITIEYLFLLLSERGLRDRHTVITTNLTPVQLQERYGERVSSRLLNRDTTGIIKLTGKDLRQYRERKG